MKPPAGWTLVCGGYYVHEDGRRLLYRRPDFRVPTRRYWFVLPPQQQHPRHDAKRYRTLAEAWKDLS